MKPIRLGLTIALSVSLSVPCALAGVIVVDPGGGGDFDSIPEAAFHAAADDTVLVMPGTYVVAAGGTYPWPIPLDGETPTFISDGGAGVTTIDGDGSTAAFSVAESANGARLSIQGFTFSLQTGVIHRDYPSYPGGPIRFEDNVVVGPTGYGTALSAGSGAGSLIARSVFTGTGGTGISFGGEGVIEDNEVSGYECGISSGELTLVRRNQVHDCTQIGIVSYGSLTASDNVIENNEWFGIALDGGFYLEGNVIRSNGTGIAWPFVPLGILEGYAHLNDICDNGTNMRTPEIMYSWEFDATMNWWGTADPEEIAAGIYDCNDPPWGGAGCVVFAPWCTAPIPECNPTAVSELSSWGVIKAIYR